LPRPQHRRGLRAQAGREGQRGRPAQGRAGQSEVGRRLDRDGHQHRPIPAVRGQYRLTRGIVAVLSEARNPFSVLTKSALVLRDLDLLAEAAGRTDVSVSLSIGTLDERVWRATEPGAPHPRRRVDAVRQLAAAGIRTGVLVAPVLPGLSDSPAQLEEVVTACVEAGAQSVTAIALHLRPGVREHFMGWLRPRDPGLAEDYERRYQRSYLPDEEQKALAARVRAI